MVSILQGIAARIRAWREREQAFAELSSLDDRALADIGIRRGDIPFVVAGRLHREGDVTSQPSFAPAANANAQTATRKVA